MVDKESQREPKRARESQREPKRARESQRESQREPDRAIESQREPSEVFCPVLTERAYNRTSVVLSPQKLFITDFRGFGMLS